IGTVAVRRQPQFTLKARKLALKSIRPLDYFRLYFPDLDISLKQLKTIAVNKPDTHTYSLRFAASQFLFDGGRKLLSLRVNKYENKMAGKELQKEIRTFRQQAVKAYINLLKLKQEIKIKQKQLAVFSSSLDIAEVKLKAGTITRVQHLEILSKKQQACLGLFSSRLAFTNALSSFRNLLRLRPKETLSLQDNFITNITVNKPCLDRTWLRKNFIRENTDFNKRKIELLKARKDLVYKKRSYIPELNLNCYYSLNDDQFIPRDKNWGITVEAAFNIGPASFGTDLSYIKEDNSLQTSTSDNNITEINKNKNWRRKIKVSKIALRQRQLAYADLKRELKNRFNQVLNNLNLSYRMLEQIKLKINIDRKKLKINKKQLQLGKITFRDYAEDLTSLTVLEISYYEKVAAYLNQANKLEIMLNRPRGSLKLYTSYTGDKHE
ncbi:MAG TPA: TolC family protein, partial [Spirochaetota bacterium]|nr:TolC family protein [Spirochaetota bacterium]